MLLFALLSLSPFLELSCAQETAFIPAWPHTLTNVKNRRYVRMVSNGRQVTIPAENVKKMADVPFSQLTTNNATIRQILIDIHNELRRNVTPTARNMLKMEWSYEAEETARKYARMCKVGHSTQSERTTSTFSCGENLFLAPFKAAWDDVIRSFYSEVVDFIYGKGAVSPSLEIGHYTQVVWATTFKFGCAIAECPNKETRYNYVCHYCPGGNYKDSIPFPYKSGPPCGDCPSACDNGLCTNPCPHQDWFGDCKKYYHGQKCDETLEKDCPATCLCTNNEIK